MKTNRKTMLWLYGDGYTYDYTIIVQTGSYSEPTVIKVYNDDSMIYTVDMDTYDKWNMFYRLSAKEVVTKHLPTSKFEIVFRFDKQNFFNMNNLSI
jgi:hypothetical protein